MTTTVTGTVAHPDGEPLDGTITLTPTYWRVDDDGDRVITALPVTEPVDAGAVAITVDTADGLVWRLVIVDVDGRASLDVHVHVPDVDEVQLGDLLPPVDPAGQCVVGTGPPGPQGDPGPTGPLGDLADVTLTDPQADESLVYNGVEWVNRDTTVVSAGPGVAWYPDSTDSGVGGYDGLTTDPAGGAEVEESAVVNNSSALIDGYITPVLGRTQLDAGTWAFDIYCRVSNASQTTTITADVYSRTSGGTETLLFTVTTPDINDTTLSLHTVSTVQPAHTLNTTDRVVVKYSATTTRLANTTVWFAHNGTEHYSHIHTPLHTLHADLAGLQGGSGSEYYHLTQAQAAAVSTLATDLAAKVPASLFDANTILKADVDDTPEAVTVTEQTVVGRVTGGEITALSATQLVAVVKDADGTGSGLDADTVDGSHAADFATASHTHTGIYQPVDGDLTAIAALSGTGHAKRTAADTWTLDTAVTTGPGSSTDNAVVRWNGTSGVLLQDSAVTVGDTGVLSASQLVATSNVIVDTASGSAYLYADKPASGSSAGVVARTGGVNRWIIAANATAEAGSDSGSDLAIAASDDSGASLGNALLITRATRNARFLASVDVDVDLNVDGVITLGTIKVLKGSGSPESVVTAPVGSLYLRSNGGAGTTLYIKESGTGSTGWAAK